MRIVLLLRCDLVDSNGVIGPLALGFRARPLKTGERLACDKSVSPRGLHEDVICELGLAYRKCLWGKRSADTRRVTRPPITSDLLSTTARLSVSLESCQYCDRSIYQLLPSNVFKCARARY